MNREGGSQGSQATSGGGKKRVSSAKSSGTDGFHSQSRSSSSFARSRPAIKLSTKNDKISPDSVPLPVTAPVSVLLLVLQYQYLLLHPDLLVQLELFVQLPVGSVIGAQKISTSIQL